MYDPTRRAAGAAKKGKRNVSSGQVHIFASFNNTIVTVTDTEGNTIAWGSAGSAGFKGSRKSTPFAARLAAEQAIKAAQQLGVQEVDLFVKGSWTWPRECDPCRPVPGVEGPLDVGHYADPAQRLPAAEKAPCVI